MQKVLILMGSKNDLPVAEKGTPILKSFGIGYEIVVASAHRTPKRVEELVTKSDADVFIAIAGLSAALPGVVASLTTRPVIGVPVSGSVNLDALLSVTQMPPGIPVAAVGLDRGDNAAILAAEMLSIGNQDMRKKLAAYRKDMETRIIADSESLKTDV
jgi:5-(carboxyamino)imidazole ribonucleotide mutase